MSQNSIVVFLSIRIPRNVSHSDSRMEGEDGNPSA